MDYRDVFHDIITHAHDFKKAIAIAREHAEVSPPDIDDQAYWDKQLRTYENIEKMAKLMTGEEEFKPVGDNAIERLISLYDSANEKGKAMAIFGEFNIFQLTCMSAAEQVALLYGDFVAEVYNGGLQQYICASAKDEGANGRKAYLIASSLTTQFEDNDPELASLLKEIFKEVGRHLEISEYDDSKFDQVNEKIFDPLERKLYAMDKDRIYSFFMKVAEGIDPKKRPMIEGAEKIEVTANMKI